MDPKDNFGELLTWGEFIRNFDLRPGEKSGYFSASPLNEFSAYPEEVTVPGNDEVFRLRRVWGGNISTPLPPRAVWYRLFKRGTDKNGVAAWVRAYR